MYRRETLRQRFVLKGTAKEKPSTAKKSKDNDMKCVDCCGQAELGIARIFICFIPPCG